LRTQISNRASATTPTSAGVATDTPTPSSSAATGGTPTPIDGGTYNVVVAGEDANVTVGSKRKLKSDVWLEFEQVTVGGKLKAEFNCCKKFLLDIVNLTQLTCVVILKLVNLSSVKKA
jgi:hypothetical protein